MTGPSTPRRSIHPREGQEGPPPTSFGQRRLWFLHRLQGGESQEYHIPNLVRLRGTLDTAALEDALTGIVERHEVLRTTISIEDETPVQSIDEPEPVGLDVTDVSDADDPLSRVRPLAKERSEIPFDLQEGPTYRFHLYRLGDGDFVLFSCIHHIAFDGWSTEPFTEDLMTLYEAAKEGRDADLDPLPVQYGDYAAWQREAFENGEWDDQLDYWRQKLDGLEPLDLPTDHPRPRRRTSEGASVSFEMSEELTEELGDLAAEHEATLFMTMLAAFKLVLHRYTHQDDIAVGTPVAGRHRPELENLVGFFVNNLTLRTDLSGNPTFHDLLQRVRDTCLEAYDHQDVPFERVVEELEPDRDPSRHPLFQVLVAWQEQGGSELALSGVSLDSVGLDMGKARADLDLHLSQEDGRVKGRLDYAEALFEAERIERMIRHYQKVLAAVVDDPDRPVGQVELLGEKERERLLLGWGSGSNRQPPAEDVVSLVDAQAQRRPTALAVEQGSASLTYEELDERANRWARWLLAVEARGQDTPVGVFLGHSLDLAVAVLAVLKAGRCYLPLDPEYPDVRIRHMVDAAQPSVILTTAAHEEALRSKRPDATILVVDGEDGVGGDLAKTPPDVELHPDQRAYLMFTSGSTGEPKGVQITHRNVVNALTRGRDRYPVPPGRFLLASSVSFEASIPPLLWAWAEGGTVVVPPESRYRDLSWMGQYAQEKEVSHLVATPSQYRTMLGAMQGGRPSAMETVILTGEALTDELVSLHEEVAPDADLFNEYGPTETTLQCTVGEVEGTAKADRQSVPVGSPVANVRLAIVDDYGRPCPEGVSGELCVAGAGVSRGYLDEPRRTADAFRPDPHGPQGARRYRTGDLARWSSSGDLVFQGRQDDQVQVRGHRVELGEVKNALLGHPDVAEATVVHATEGSHDHLIGYVIPASQDNTPQLWPSTAEYLVYDDVLYFAMANDETRNQAYRNALDGTVDGKTVADIGTGPEALLARLAADAGADHVYAIELLEDTYHQAARFVDQRGLDDQITVIHGDIRDVDLPQPPDVCVSEIVGSIAGAEGAAVLHDAVRDLLGPNGETIPHQAETRIAGIETPPHVHETPTIDPTALAYFDRIFDEVGHPFDLRVCLDNVDPTDLLTTQDVFENLDFTDAIDPEYERDITLEVTDDGHLSGFLLWLRLHVDEDNVLDILTNDHVWLPVYLPVFDDPQPVQEGDTITARVRGRLTDDDLHLDYTINGTLQRPGRNDVAISYVSHHHGQAHRSNAFYDALFDELDDHKDAADEDKTPGDPTTLASTLRRDLRDQLPSYMVPSQVVEMDEIPLTPNGKIDQDALPAPDPPKRRDGREPPEGPLEERLAEIWAELLDVDRVGRHDNFFELGGHSLSATRVVSQLRSEYELELSVQDLFSAPTVERLAGRIRTEIERRVDEIVGR